MELFEEGLSPLFSKDKAEDTSNKKEKELLLHGNTIGDFESNPIKVNSNTVEGEPNLGVRNGV